MARSYRPSAYLPASNVLECGPLMGMRDTLEPTTSDPSLARRVVNCYRAAGPEGVGLVGRPGFEQLAAAFGDVVQAGLQTWTQFDGTMLHVAVVDGQVWTYDFITNAGTVVLSYADLIGAGVLLSLTARVALVPFADQLVISDGVNPMIWWDGIPGGGMTDLGIAAYGVPGVYAGKLMLVGAGAHRNTMYWSLEGDATRGYDLLVDGFQYENAWDNPGGYNEPLTVVLGTNEALYVFRARSALAILGAADADFQTAHTKANLSPTVGTSSPWACLSLDQGVFVVDSDASPQLFKYGAIAPQGLWRDCLETVKRTPRPSLPNALAAYDETTNQVWLGLPVEGSNYPSQWCLFHADTLQFSGVQTWGVESSTLGVVIDAAGLARLSHSDRVGGRILLHGEPVDGPWSDYVLGAWTAIAHEVRGPRLGWDVKREALITAIEFGLNGLVTEVNVWYETERGESPPQTIRPNTGDILFELDEDTLDDHYIGGAVTQVQATARTGGRGRSVIPILSHAVLDEPFGLDVIRVTSNITQGNNRVP